MPATVPGTGCAAREEADKACSHGVCIPGEGQAIELELNKVISDSNEGGPRGQGE